METFIYFVNNLGTGPKRNTDKGIRKGNPPI